MRLAEVILLVAAAATPAQAAPQPKRSLQQRASQFVADLERTSCAVVGVSAVDLRTGRKLIGIRDGEPFIPASNQKLLTSAFALVRLGGDFRFVTGVFHAGRDVVVAGDGDPTLGDPRLAQASGKSIYAELDRWAAAIRRKAGRSVRNVLLWVPSSCRYRHPDWPANQHHHWYAAPVGPLNFHDNCVDVTFRLTGRRVTAVIRPQSRYVRVVNRLAPGPKHLWSLRTNADDSVLTLVGAVRQSTTEPVSAAIDHPPLLLGRTLAERMIRAGVRITGRIRPARAGEVQWSGVKLLCLSTTGLSAAMRRANKRSLNMAAEAIFLRAGDGTWAGSAAIARETLIKSYGLPSKGLVVRDGGGLSRRNRVSPAAVTKLLREVARRSDAMVVLTSLPIGGVDGSLASRFRTPPCRGRVVAKTGTLGGVSCLSGYVLDESHTGRIVFSVMINDITGSKAPARGLEDATCRLLVDSIPTPEARGNAPRSLGGSTP